MNILKWLKDKITLKKSKKDSVRKLKVIKK